MEVCEGTFFFKNHDNCYTHIAPVQIALLKVHVDSSYDCLFILFFSSFSLLIACCLRVEKKKTTKYAF